MKKIRIRKASDLKGKTSNVRRYKFIVSFQGGRREEESDINIMFCTRM